MGLNHLLGEASQKSKKPTVDYRRSTAAQFFVDEEDNQEPVSPEEVVRLLNSASLAKDENVTLKDLLAVQELILKKDIKLLDNFLDEVVNFQHHKNIQIRRFVVRFIKNACEKDPKTLPKVISNLVMMLEDPSSAVQKQVVEATAKLYTVAIEWLCSAKTVDDIMVATWASMTELKTKIVHLLDSDNEGVRAMSVKFMESVILAQSAKDKVTVYKKDELSLEDIPLILKVFKPRKMEEEANDLLHKIIDFHGASHVSSCNLMACIGVMTIIGKRRFQFFSKVLQAFESLHANLPPTLSQSQVTSVRKYLKLELLILAKHPGAVEFQAQVSILLSDLGATQSQINKCFPLPIPKREPKEESWAKPTKSSKIEAKKKSPSKPVVPTKKSAIDATVEDLIPKFNHVNVADLVLVNMLNLPEDMPAHFQSTYTPIAAAGTEPQVRHIARLLATQLVLAGLGKTAEAKDESEVDSDDEDGESSGQIKTVIGRTTDHMPKKQGVVLIPSGSSQLKTSRVTKNIDFQLKAKPLSAKDANRLCRSAFNRILDAEKAVAKKGAAPIRTKILTTLATQFGGDMATDLQRHIMKNPRNNLDLAFQWLYQQYSSFRNFEGFSGVYLERYEEIVNSLLADILQDEQNCALFNRFFYDLPYITEGMTECLKIVIAKEAFTDQALDIASNMTTLRPPQKLLFLGVICDLTLHENNEVRSKVVDAAVSIYESGRLRSFIETFALRSLKFLLDPVPKNTGLMLFQQLPDAWTEDLIKVCLHLYFALLPLNHSLIFDLGTVYVETSADVKRTILRALEVPVKNMSMSSPELLRFVETCPQGAETFVTRIIHILTDKAPPSAELVSRVRDIYEKRVQDVRFLIPIITGLKKREVIAALPELIKLNPTVVKEVFHRLVGSNLNSPLSPAELLIALHNINSANCSLKIVIKATSLCFEEKNVYTQSVLAMVLQQLMEQNPLPILLMRTVIQSLANHPHLLGFVTNILQRLILKEVWKQPKIWEGFIKCCQRTKPQSFQVLLQLPPTQLEEVLKTYPDLRDPLLQHVGEFTEKQRSHIPKTILSVLDIFQPKDVEMKGVDESEEGPKEPPPPGEDMD
ncbi:hypothetical protein JTE90_020913 [Oedothorax gibbosus]|uniref:Symplekin n=1 Tax=Oedothorax gibbosus TaxID=931172 RepID=A0AAV6VPU6_9ARAC|nr:hypothetical protein JTE90_020913 [Oedothorax gibbosus]